MATFTELQYRAALEPWRRFEETQCRLKEAAGAARPNFEAEHEERRLFDRLIGEVIPALRSALGMPDAIEALGIAVDGVTDWRASHLNEPISPEVWGPVFVASQAIGAELRRWSDRFPAAYREVFLHER